MHVFVDHLLTLYDTSPFWMASRWSRPMTVGSDVSSLFPDVVNCMQTNSLDLKWPGRFMIFMVPQTSARSQKFSIETYGDSGILQIRQF